MSRWRYSTLYAHSCPSFYTPLAAKLLFDFYVRKVRPESQFASENPQQNPEEIVSESWQK